MAQTGQTTATGGRTLPVNPSSAALRPITLATSQDLNYLGVYCFEQTTVDHNSVKGAIYTEAGTKLYETSVYSGGVHSTTTPQLVQLPFAGQNVAAGNYILAVSAGPSTSDSLLINGQNGPGGVPVSAFLADGMYPTFPADISGIWGTVATRSWDLFIDHSDPTGASEPDISGLSDTTLTHGQTGVVISGTNFSASGNTVLVCTIDDVADPLAVSQPISAQDADEITLGALDLDSFAFGTLYVFVVNDGDESNATGEVVSRIVASATLNFTGADFFFDENGDPVEMTGTLYVYRSPRPPTSVGTPDQIITGFATSSAGERSQGITLGSLDDGDSVFYVLFGSDGTDFYSAGEVLPDYG